MEIEGIKLELINAVGKPDAFQGVRLLMLKLRNESSDNVLEAMLDFFFNDDLSSYQMAAGGLLWRLKPKYNRNLKEDVRHSLQGWNVSIEEFPWYLAEATSIEEVRNVVESLLNDSLSNFEERVAETYLYWLSVETPERMKALLDRQWNKLLED